MLELAQKGLPAPARRPMPRDHSIELDGVDLDVHGKPLLRDVSVAFGASGITCVMGPNGAGKSLLLRLMAGLIRPSRGHITWFGDPLPDRHRVALVFQSPVLLRRSVGGNLRHALKTYGVPRRNRSERVGDLLALGRLDELAERPARVLSGGEKQRLAMVRALAAEPSVLLLDEPTTSLDPQATAMIEDLVTDAAARGIKVLIVTHDQGQARRLGDSIVFMHGGTVDEHSPAGQFFERPASAAARAYLEGRLLLS